MADPRLKTHRAAAGRHLAQAGTFLAKRQVMRGPARGNVPPWSRSDDLDLHGTLQALWVWSRAHRLSGEGRFAPNLGAGWAFVDHNWKKFVPGALGPTAPDEAAYDCALTLRAAIADRAAGGDKRRPIADAAARLLAANLDDLEDLGGREFRDPGFLAWNLAEYARAIEDRGLLGSARKFVERAFGMKPPPPFASEPTPDDGLFDFSSTSASRVMAVLSAEGTTPFIGAWLRERVAPVSPRAIVRRPLDETTWNCCVAWCLGRAYALSTDPAFLGGYTAILDEVARRDRNRDAAVGRDASFPDAETASTFYYALATDSLVGSS